MSQSRISRRKLIKAAGALSAAQIAAKAHALPRRQPPAALPSEHRRVIILGSGFGGSITALRLVQQGIPVTLIEQGRRWDQQLKAGTTRFSKNLYPDGRSTWLSGKTVIPMGPPLPIRKTTGVLQGRWLAGKTVLNGAAYGGGSITWGGVMVKPEKHIFEQVFGDIASYEELAPYYDLVGKKLGRSPIPDDVIASEPYRHARVMKEHCEKAGIKWEPIETSTNWDIVRDELDGKVEPSITRGEAVYGVNSGAKGGLDKTYLKEAEATGLLEILTLHQVQTLQARDDGEYELTINVLNIDGDVEAVKTFTAEKVFLCLGSISTSSLIAKAKAKKHLPRLNDAAGKGWGNNGNAYALRLGIKDSTGKIQGGPPSVGINALDNPHTPVFIEHPQLPVSLDFHGLLYFSIGITDTRGEFVYDEKKDEVTIKWPKHDQGQEKVNDALLSVLKTLNDANGGWTSSLLTYLRDKVKDDICFHPLGGMVLGEACDRFGRVIGHPGLYVNDSSMLPGASGCCNPAMTISALAERNIREIAASDF